MNLSEIVGQVSKENTQDTPPVDIITFAEAPWGLNMNKVTGNTTLRPVQKMILKCFYNIPLEEKEKTIIVRDFLNEQELYRFTEKEYLGYLWNEGRTNLREQTFSINRNELILVCGRRGGKSKLGAIVSAYEAYALLKKPHPQKHFGITDNAEIYISTVATSTDQAQLLFNDIAAYIDHSPYFTRYKNPPTLQYMTLRTSHDIESDTKSSSIIIQAAPCSARGLRGMSNMVVIMDEQAHFVDSSSNTSDTVIYDAVTPSTLSFGKEAKILNLSSPLNKQGKLWELYNQSFGSEKLLMFQIPTWELYPDIDSSELRERYRRNPDVYWCEIGAKFSDTVKSWMPREQLLRCVDHTLKKKVRGSPRTPHFMGVDIGLKKDMTAFSVVHIEHIKEPVFDLEGRVIDEIIVPKYEMDYQEVMQAGVGEFANMEFLDFDTIADRIEAVAREFAIHKGLFDQYNGVPLKQSLDKKGLTQFEMMYFDRRINSELYNNFILQVIDGKLRLYDEDGSAETPGTFISEILDLQSEYVSKYITMVFAPEVEGKHDDRSDSFVRALWCATQWAMSKGAMDPASVRNQYDPNAIANMKKQMFGRGYTDSKRMPVRNGKSPYSVFFNKGRRR
jgi:hypothetical protein